MLELLRRYLDPNAGDGGGGDGGDGGAGDGGDGGVAVADWVKVLPEEAHKDPNVLKYKTPQEFYEGYKNQTKLIGAKGVIVPGENAKPEEKEAFYNALGRPAKPEGYKLEPIEGLHKSIEITPESSSAFQAMAHKFGLNNETANGLNQFLMSAVNQVVVNQEKAQQESMLKAETALRQEWGKDYEKNKAAVGKLALTVGGQEFLDAMGGADGLGNNPIVMKVLAKIQGAMSEDQVKNISVGPGSTSKGEESQADALKKIGDIKSMTTEERNKHPYWNENDPKHDEAVKEMSRLYGIAYPPNV
jgi:hypothetical protein